MATLYPALGEPQTIETPEGGFHFMTIRTLINGVPFYTHVESRNTIVAICERGYSLGMPRNRHENTFKLMAQGDVLVMSLEELAREEYEQQERWVGDIPGITG